MELTEDFIEQYNKWVQYVNTGYAPDFSLDEFLEKHIYGQKEWSVYHMKVHSSEHSRAALLYKQMNLAQRAVWRKFGEANCLFCGAYLGGDKHFEFRDESKLPAYKRSREDISLYPHKPATLKKNLTDEDLRWLHFVWVGWWNNKTLGGIMYFNPRLKKWQTVCRKHALDREIEDVFL